MPTNNDDRIQVYYIDHDTGERNVIGCITETLSIVPIEDDVYTTYTEEIAEAESLTITFSVFVQPKRKLMLWGLTNNSIRLHGGRPLRTIPKRFIR